MKMAYVLGIVGSMFLAAGCASNAPPDRTAADRALEHNLRADLDRYGDLAAQRPYIRIFAHNGAVTLTGQVRTERDREMIDSLVRNATGVYAVVDQLQVAYSPTGVVSPYPSAQVYASPPPSRALPAPVVIPGPAAVPGEYPSPRVRASAASRSSSSTRVGALTGSSGAPP